MSDLWLPFDIKAGTLGAAFAGSPLRMKMDGRDRQLATIAAKDALSYAPVPTATSSSH